MGGSSLFAIVSKTMTSDKILTYVFVVASIALALPLAAGSSTIGTLVAFLLFEACVGMYWPAIGTVKSQVTTAGTATMHASADPSTLRRGRTPRLSLTGPSPSE